MVGQRIVNPWPHEASGFDPLLLHQYFKSKSKSTMYYKDLETDKQAMRDYNQRTKENAAARRAPRADAKRK